MSAWSAIGVAPSEHHSFGDNAAADGADVAVAPSVEERFPVMVVRGKAPRAAVWAHL
jgi:hypothetical protein